MDFNEWTQYTKIGSTCDYDDRTNQFIEQYNNATFQTYMDNERKNRAIQRADQIRTQGWEILPTNSERENGTVSLHQRSYNKKVYTSMLRRASMAMDKLRKYIKPITK